MATPLRVLILEDNSSDAELMLHSLRRAGYAPTAECVETEQEYRDQLRRSPEIILADYTLPKFDAVRALEILSESGLNIPFIVVSGTIGDESAVQIMQHGATDYILKDRMGRLGPAVSQGIERKASAAAAARARELNEDALRRSEQRYRTLVAATTAIVWDSPPSGAFDTDQPAWTAFTGQSLEEHRGWGWLNAIHPDDREKSSQAWGAALKQLRVYQIEHRVLRADGLYRHMSARAVPILEHDGTIREWVGVHSDVTDQKRAEDSLLENEARLADAVRLARLGYWRRDLATGRLDWSDLLFDIFGVDPLAFGRTYESFLAILHPDDREVERERIAKAVVEAGPFDHTYRIVVRGGIRVIHEVGRVVAGPDDRPTHVVGTAQDITERTRAEEELRRTSGLLQAVADGTTDAIYVKDREGRYQFFNQAAARFVGRTVEDVLGKDDTALFDPIGARRIMEQAARIMASGLVVTNDEVLTAAGVTRTYHTTEAPQWDADGNVIGIIGIARDVTTRLRLETERAALLAQVNLQIERMPLAYLLCGPDFRYTRWNPAAERMFGFAEAEVLGKRPSEIIIPPHAVALVAGLFARLAAGDMDAHGTSENLTRNGPTITCEWHNTPLFGLDGTFEGVLSLAQDVTARYKAEEAARVASLRLAYVLASSPAIVFTLAIVDDQVRGLSWISENVQNLLGFSAQEALAPDWWKVNIHPDDHDRVMAQTQAKVIGEGNDTHEYRFRHADGNYRWTRGELRLIRDAANRAVEAVGSWTDITDRRNLEDQFRQAQKMEAFGQLAGGVAHDFNNLLTVINGYSDMLLQSIPRSDPSWELIDEIHTAGERSAGLTRQLLAFSRQQIMAPRVLDLNGVVDATQKLLSRLIGEDVRLATVLAPDLWAVLADPGQVEQVLMNLAVNARDAMPTGGRLTIETRNIDLDESYTRTHANANAGPHVLLSVADTGCGMPPEVLAKVFEPFFTTKGPGKGTGLGLATAFGIINQSGGHIGVYSEVGVGTTFKIYLPRVKKLASGSRARPGLRPSPQGVETILLVEDDDGVRLLTKYMLTGLGYTVVESSGGAEALRLAGQHAGPIHLLMTDVVMPGMSGRQLAELLAGSHPETRVLFVSGYTDDAIVRHGILEEKVQFLPKPFTPAALAMKVRDVLDETPPVGLDVVDHHPKRT